MAEPEKNQIVLKGISGAPGICIGKAYLVDREGVDLIKRYPISEEGVPAEINRFKNAVKRATDEHAAIIDSLHNDLREQMDILETHLVLFKDKMLYGKTIETIKTDRINAEWALKKVSRQIRRMFMKVNDPYLKSRVTDIAQVSEQVMRHLVGAQDIRISDINKRVILVAHDLSPADTSQIQLELIKGFVTDRGGKDSHTGIIAKSLAIPAVMGLGNVTHCVENDDILIVDGNSGVLIINPEEDTLFSYEARRANYEHQQASLARDSHLPAVTLDGVKMRLMANIELVEEVVSVRDNAAKGVGLFRTEFLYIDLKRFPSEEELFEKYKEVVELLTPKPVTFRTLDINGDKVLPYMKGVEEENPALGLRAVRFCLKRPEIFITQIKAILRAAAFGNTRLLIPMISCVDEIIKVKEIIGKAVEELKKEQKVFNQDIPLGIMIEIPSAVIIAEDLAEHVDFFSIGTNDLIQYSMAIDRRNRQVAHLYHTMNPALIRMVKMVVDAANKKNIEITMCGEMAGDPLNLPILMGLGLRELSMNSMSIPLINQMVRRLNAVDTRAFVEKVIKMGKASDIEAFVKETYGNILSD
ncbi:Phosphoenolpyruvate-protein phosphotransferase [Desulfamplus magnetovallimortis]|uniref:Phosphoenolpyruvate-protein phosphotransferase n=1 Tax=Desulfamplus magnetovallimortis TaxID=1246637 RepID=A0A1W1H8D9_9BACT|nr:phosphoenolpyruvate--protein phosphotransferase [Desulfamplus magnetovallimortis]SLM28739.1 Phosphoenolpyruvate-protein phosphotransferase [Desulfamplus magnetovallimortis]